MGTPQSKSSSSAAAAFSTPPPPRQQRQHRRRTPEWVVREDRLAAAAISTSNRNDENDIGAKKPFQLTVPTVTRVLPKPQTDFWETTAKQPPTRAVSGSAAAFHDAQEEADWEQDSPLIVSDSSLRSSSPTRRKSAACTPCLSSEPNNNTVIISDVEVAAPLPCNLFTKTATEEIPPSPTPCADETLDWARLLDDPASMLAALPASLTHLFGRVGFAKWRKAFQPALLPSPFQVPPQIRAAWRQRFLEVLAKNAHKNSTLDDKKIPIILYWYGEKHASMRYAILQNYARTFVPLHKAPRAWIEQAEAVRNKHGRARILTAKERRDLGRMKELWDDLRHYRVKTDPCGDLLHIPDEEDW